MSTKQTDGGEAHQPTPTAQRSEGGDPELPNPRVNRREMLKITGAAAGAAAVGAGTASANTGINASWSDEDWHEYDGDNADVTDRTHGVLDWHEYENDEPSADATNLHLQIQNEGEWFDDHDTVLENHYQDMHTIAHIDARNGITNEWEDGGGQSEGYDAALDAIEDYWAIHEQNDINAGLRVLTNFAHFSDAAQANDDVPDALLTLSCDWDAGDTHALGVVTADFQPAEFELLNGAMFETRVPRIEFYEPVEDDEAGDKIGETLLSPAVLQDAEGDDWYDTEFTFEDVNDDGDTITTGGRWNLQNLPDYEDSEFPGIGSVFHMGYWYQQFSRHDAQAATVQANYDESLVGEIYDALDDGEISPSDVRSSVGMARHMGGTDDALADSFRIALLMQLGIDQPDLEGVASQTVNIDGATARRVDADDNTRHVFPDEYREIEDAEGLLYARSTPEQGYVTGETLANPSMICVDSDDNVDLRNVLNPDKSAEIDTGRDGNDNDGVLMVPEYRLAVVGGGSTLTAYDYSDGSEAWTRPVQTTAVDTDGDQIFIASFQDEELAAVDPEDGSENWTTDAEEFNEAYYSARDDVIYASGRDDLIMAFDPSDGSELWTDSTPTEINGFVTPSDGDTLYFIGDDNLTAFDVEDRETEWSESITLNNGDEIRLAPDESEIAVAGDGEVVGFDLDGSKLWTYGTDRESLKYLPDGSLLAADFGEPLERIDDGDLVNQYDFDCRYFAVSHRVEADGLLESPIFYDAANSEELQLTSATVEIVEQVDADGEEVESSDTNTPEYDTNDVTEYTETVEKHTTVYEETIVNNYDQGDGGGGDWWPSAPSAPSVDDFGSQLAGLVVLAVIVVSVIWSVVSDAVPFLGN